MQRIFRESESTVQKFDFTITELINGKSEIIAMVELLIMPHPRLKGRKRAKIFADVENVWTREDARGRGLARSLVRTALKKARREHCLEAVLTSRPGREAARALYESLGFKPYTTGFLLEL